MPLAAISNALHQAQRRQLRARRWLRRMLFLGKSLAVPGSVALALGWGAYGLWEQVVQADYFKLAERSASAATGRSPNSGSVTFSPYRRTIRCWPSICRASGTRLARHPFIQTVALRRLLPDTLQVTIQEQSPALVIRSRTSRASSWTPRGMCCAISIPNRTAFPAAADIERTERVVAWHAAGPATEIRRAFELLQTYRLSPLNGTMRLRQMSVSASGASVWKVEPYSFELHVRRGADHRLNWCVCHMSWITSLIKAWT